MTLQCIMIGTYIYEIHTTVAINTSTFHSLFLMTTLFYDLELQAKLPN